MTSKVEGAGEKRRFVAALSVAAPFREAPVVIAEGPDGVWFGPVSTQIQDGILIAEGPVETEAGRWIGRETLDLTVLGTERAITLKGCAAKG